MTKTNHMKIWVTFYENGEEKHQILEYEDVSMYKVEFDRIILVDKQ